MAGIAKLRILLVGPVPPPDGGMANQTRQLAKLLEAEGADVRMIPVNAPYRPRWVGGFPGVRAGARLIAYVGALLRATSNVDVMHLMANSGWSWHLAAAPAVWIASMRGIPVVLNYRGGGAEEFFRGAIGWIRPTLRRCTAIIVPSAFLQRIFERYGFHAEIVPNIVDLARFAPVERGVPDASRGPHLIVARHLEPIYDNATAIRALGVVRERYPGATLSVAGLGNERAALESLARELGLESAVTFTGRLDNEQMASLYRRADFALNPSRVDNMPISILEALASGVPVVSTNAGGIPDLVTDGVTAALVPPGDPNAMGGAVLNLLGDPARKSAMVRAGLDHVRRFTWEHVKVELESTYTSALRREDGSTPATRASKKV